jgi:Na+/melibiose symporter-like transporter
MDIKNFTVRQPGSKFVVAIFFDFFILITFFMLLKDFDNPNNKQAMFMMIPFLLVFSFLTFLWFYWKIEVNDDQIKVRSFFGGKKTFTFGDITKVKHIEKSTQFATKIECFTAYIGSRVLFTVTSNCPDCQLLIAVLIVKGVDIEWKTKEYGEYIANRTEEFREMIRNEQEKEKNKEEHGEGYYEV